MHLKCFIPHKLNPLPEKKRLQNICKNIYSEMRYLIIQSSDGDSVIGSMLIPEGLINPYDTDMKFRTEDVGIECNNMVTR